MLMLVRSAGTSLDAGLVRLFITLMGVYPPRSAIRLSTDEVAIVLMRTTPIQCDRSSESSLLPTASSSNRTTSTSPRLTTSQFGDVSTRG